MKKSAFEWASYLHFIRAQAAELPLAAEGLVKGFSNFSADAEFTGFEPVNVYPIVISSDEIFKSV